jgi:putative transposase
MSLHDAKEGVFMRSVTQSGDRRGAGFRHVVAGFLSRPGLPFADVLSADRVERIFAKHGNLFGGTVYSTVVTLWAFLGQALRDGKEASCRSAVAHIVVHQAQAGLPVPTEDTGDYCRARAKLSVAALRDVTVEVAEELERQADPAWLWKGRHAKLVDGFHFTLADTPANQAEFPQLRSQKPGVGFPLVRACAILSLATACVMELAIGPYAGKKTGETALLRELLGSFREGDVAVADRFYCSFLMIALLMQRKVDVCARIHQARPVDFRRGRRLGKNDRLIVWTRPQRPDWMDEETYRAIPETLTLRMIRYDVVEPGRRVRTLTVVTTLLDAETHSSADVAELYGFRWNAELDIRSIKQALRLDHLRCKSPEMVRKELWTILLGYNLIRTTAAAAALLHGKKPRQISFTGTCQYVLASWSNLSSELIAADKIAAYCRALLDQIAGCEVADRPGRFEPRVLKRRRHRYPLMRKSRACLKTKLQANP